MSRNEQSTINALESLQRRKIYIEDGFTKVNCFNTDNEPDIYRSFYVTLALNGHKTSPYDAGTTSFDKFRATMKPNPHGFFFLFQLLFVENIKKYGGVCSLLKYSSTRYVKLVHAIAMKYAFFNLTEQHKQLIDRYTIRNEYEDLQFLHDIAYEVTYIKWVKNTILKRKGKRKKKNFEDDDGEAEQNQNLLSERDYFSHVHNEGNQLDMDNMEEDDNQDNDNEHITLTYEDFRSEFDFISDVKPYFVFAYIYSRNNNITDEMTIPSVVIPPNKLKPAPRKRIEVSNLLDHGGMIDDAGNVFPTKEVYNGPQKVVKASFCWSVIPNRKNEPTVALATVLIRSKEINVGVFQCDLIRNNEERLSKINSGYRDGYKMELFPNYQNLFYKGYHPTANSVNKQTFVSCIRECAPDVYKKVANGNPNEFYNKVDMLNDNDTHLYRVLSIEEALKYCRNNDFDIDANLLDTKRWIDYKTNTCMFPVPTWKPTWAATFWHNPTYVGFTQKYMFHIDMKSDFLKQLCSASGVQNFLQNGNFSLDRPEEAQQAVDDHINSLERLLVEAPIVSIAKISSNPLLRYDTSNQFVHATAERDVIYGKLKKHIKFHFHDTYNKIKDLIKIRGPNWRDGLRREPELKKQVEEYEAYAKLLNTTQDALMNVFRTLWPLSGSVDDLNISDPLKVMAKWYQDNKNRGNLPHLTRVYKTWDKELDFFGNTQIQHLALYVDFQRVLQPIICLVSEGLFSCYDANMNEMCFNQIIHGRYDTGKSFTGITTLIKFTCIPGTVSEFSLATKAADVTRKHANDEIIASDECPDWMISEQEAAKFPEQVNKEKLKKTRNQLSQRTFATVTLPNGESVRWNEDVVTDHKTSHVYITNKAAESKRALSSRMHRTTMKQSKVPANQMRGPMDGTLKDDAAMWCHINQYLSCCGRKAAAVGVIQPEIQMELFDQIANATLYYLKEWHCIEDAGARPLEIITPYFRQLVYKMAIRYAFDLPSSPNYKKEFSLEMIREIQPYLYGTVSQIWWAFTACASEYIEDDNSNVIRAMIKEAGIVWQEGDTCYGIYERDTKSAIPFKTYINHAHQEGQPHEDKVLIDISYIRLTGDETTLCNKIALHTNPRMDGASVKAVIHQLSEHLFKPENGGYIPQPMGRLQKWHKYSVLPSQLIPLGKKCIDTGCPEEYNPGGFPINSYRTMTHMPSFGEQSEKRFPVIDVSEWKKTGNIYFIPSAVNSFQQKMLQMALQAATFCSTTPEGKILQGFPDINDPTRMTVFTAEKEDIDKYVAAFDEKNGYGLDENGKWTFLDKDVPEKFRPVSRKNDGISFNFMAAMSDKETKLISGQPLAPKTDDKWKQQYEDGGRAMCKAREVVKNLDKYSATLQHLASGRPLDEEVKTPAWILKQYQKSLAPGEPSDLGLDYPYDYINGKIELNKLWKTSYGESNNRAVIEKSFNSMLSVSNMSREEREQRKIGLQQQRQQPQEPNVVNNRIGSAPAHAVPVSIPTPKKSKSKKSKTPGSSERVESVNDIVEDETLNTNVPDTFGLAKALVAGGRGGSKKSKTK